MKIDECAGSVSGAGDTACSNSTPSRARRSRFGVSIVVESVGVDAIGARRVERDEQQVEIGGTYAGGQMTERLTVHGENRAGPEHVHAASAGQRQQ